ncbi:MAG TPA: hypothetical protein VNF74_08415 [Terriglobales bacterium]|nr:hypothetical protein [Terriglobales bacterium]
MKPWRIALLGLGLALLAAAVDTPHPMRAGGTRSPQDARTMPPQGRGGRARMRGLEAIPGAAPELVLALYQQAARALNAVPAMAAPQMLADIASDEMRLFPQQGLADYRAAFDLARALPPPRSADDTLGQAREGFKENAEREAIRALARRGEQTEALALTRLADIPKAPLYDLLIALAERRAQAAAPATPAGAPGETTAERVFALVEECKRAGNYPYTGVAIYLRQRGAADLDRMMLVQDGYQWAGNETDPAQMGAAAAFLQAAHRAEPELDGMLESTLRELLRRLDQTGTTSAAFGLGRFAQIRLLALLRQVDAPAAAALAAQDPAMSGLLPGLGFGGRLDGQAGGFAFRPQLGGRGLGLMLVWRSPNAAGLETASAEAGGASAFRALLGQAESQQRRDPSRALALAGQAAGLLDGALWTSETAAAARLAALEQQLGDGAAASRLLARCLQEADRQARAMDATYLGGDASQRTHLAQGLEAAQNSVLAVYSLAARLDFLGTAERAEAAQFALLKPLVLARVALVGEVGQRPAAPR